jgi:hypothetical protein
MGYSVSDSRNIRKGGVYGEGHNAPWPSELSTRNDDAGCYPWDTADLSDQLLHLIDTAEQDVTLKDGLVFDDMVLDSAVSKGVALDETCAYFWACTKLF